MSDTPTLTTRDEWLVLIGYEAGLDDGKAAAAILQELIAELRDAVKDYPPTVFREFTDDDPASQSRTVDRIAGVAMRHAWTRAGEMADRAEARLREVQGE